MPSKEAFGRLYSWFCIRKRSSRYLTDIHLLIHRSNTTFLSDKLFENPVGTNFSTLSLNLNPYFLSHIPEFVFLVAKPSIPVLSPYFRDVDLGFCSAKIRATAKCGFWGKFRRIGHKSWIFTTKIHKTSDNLYTQRRRRRRRSSSRKLFAVLRLCFRGKHAL